MSKSGSKALSKSVDSAVKSVESVVTSVLPKNMNMKHVLLAILVGLLLCMLMGNTVEGLISVQDNPTPACPSGSSVRQLTAQSGTTGGPEGQGPTANMSNVDKWGCYKDDAPDFSTGQADENNWGQLSTDPQGSPLTDGCGSPPSGNAPTGLCKPKLGASPADSNACYTEGQTGGSTVCGTPGNTENCEWIDKTTYNNNGLLTGDALNMLLQNLNIKKYQCSDDSSNLNFATFEDTYDQTKADKNLSEIKNTTILPIMGIVNDDDNVITADPSKVGTKNDKQTGRDTVLTEDDHWKNLSNPETGAELTVGAEYKDLLYYLFKYSGQWDSLKTEKDPTKWVGAINQNDKIPDDLKAELSLITKNCAESWNNDTLKDIYPHNGGRPIIGIDKHTGAVCRNTPYKPRVEVINEWRLHVGEGCPGSVSADGKKLVDGGDKLTCESNAPCDSINPPNALDKFTSVIASQNPFAVNNRCGLKSCRDSATLCPTQNLTDYTASLADSSLKNVYDTFGIPF